MLKPICCFIQQLLFTIHCTFPLDSSVIPVHTYRLRQNLWNSIEGPVLVLNPANARRNVFSLEHLRDALIHTIFEHSLGKTIGHVSDSDRANVVRAHDVAPISYRPEEKRIVELFLRQISLIIFVHTLNACFRPPLSAIFSPCVIRPFMYIPTSSILYFEY